MRLELKNAQEPGTGKGAIQGWYFEHGRRTIGRSSNCDWQIPDAPRSVSKLHCTIERDREGFLLRDESANGTIVDGVVVLEGETARLSSGSKLECSGFAFLVQILGENNPDLGDPDPRLPLSDENLTISAILSDIAPHGQTATGIVGRFATGDATDHPIRPTPRAGIETAPSSRNVEIGWNGPPETAGMKPILPSDWNENFDYGNKLEHAPAPHVSMPATKPRRQAETSKPSSPTAPVLIFGGTQEARPAAGSVQDLLRRIEPLLERCDEASRSCFAVLDIEPGMPVDTPHLPSASQEEIVLARLETLLARQSALNTALEGLLRHASHAMEPRIVEARVDAEPRRLPWRTDRSYWQAYRQQFDNDGNDIPVQALFRRAMLRALAIAGDDEADTTEKESPIR